MKQDDRVTSAAELKARLSHYLRIVRRGGRVVVTHRGQAIAALEPIADAALDERTARLLQAGLARPAGRPLPDDFWQERAPEDAEGRALSALLEDRLGGR